MASKAEEMLPSSCWGRNTSVQRSICSDCWQRIVMETFTKKMLEGKRKTARCRPNICSSCLHVVAFHCDMNRTKTLQTAECVLSSLQNNAAMLERLRRRKENPGQPLQTMKGFLHRTGISVGELDTLKVVHVTGTKGKGSTCAFTERILRNYGFRTGFYSSPHLVHVRERIRINGTPVSEKLFTKYFWEAYERLEDTKDIHGGSMPFYFQFLTLLAFHIFLQEQVDLAVIEVGIGGEHDCTNIIRNPWVCGISSLGFDHCSLLGDTLEKIAWQKAGIFKAGAPAFTVRQEPGPHRVLQVRAQEIGCPLWVCPELNQYGAGTGWDKSLGIAGDHQHLNASLALQLSNAWLQRHRAGGTGFAEAACRPSSQAEAFQLSGAMLQGLQQTQWPGRNQTLQRGSVTYFLDGAHTTDSVQACVSWFRQERRRRGHTRCRGLKILLFNTTGERDAAALLSLLLPCRFDFVLFCPNVTEAADHGAAPPSLAGCRENLRLWQQLAEAELPPPPPERPLPPPAQTVLLPCIVSALRWIERGAARELKGGAAPPPGSAEDRQVCVLVTGSLHLVGGVLKHLEPSLDS